jgi:hypothetical protein
VFLFFVCCDSSTVSVRTRVESDDDGGGDIDIDNSLHDKVDDFEGVLCSMPSGLLCFGNNGSCCSSFTFCVCWK